MRSQKKHETSLLKFTTKNSESSTRTRLHKKIIYLREANQKLSRQILIAQDEHNTYVQKVEGLIQQKDELQRRKDELQHEINEQKDGIIAELWRVIACFAAEDPDKSLCITNSGIALILPSSK